MTATSEWQDENAERSRRLVLHGFLFARLAGLAQLVVSLLVWSRWDEEPVLTYVWAGIVFAETTLLGWDSLRHGRVRRRGAAFDVTVASVLLVLSAWQAPGTGFHPWSFLWPFSFVVAVAAGVAFTRLGAVVALTAVLATGYVVATMLFRQGTLANIPQDLITYFGIAIVSWGLVRELQRLGRALDDARRRELAKQIELSTERERTRHLSDLHDHVLQTLETLARGTFVDDERVQAQIAREALWLRRLVEGEPVGRPSHPGDLAAALADVVEQRTLDGLRVDLHTARLRELLPADVTQAMAGAVAEALTNVRKHSGVSHAVVRATPEDDGVTVSVLDQGSGFDPSTVSGGLGLRDSIHGRINQVGGRVRLDTTPGAGTYLELWVPATQQEGNTP